MRPLPEVARPTPEHKTAALIAYLIYAHYNAPIGADIWIVASFLALQRP
jgi:hypothetical protein